MLQSVDRSAGGPNFGESFSGHAPVVNTQASIFEGIWNVCVLTTGTCRDERSSMFGPPMLLSAPACSTIPAARAGRRQPKSRLKNGGTNGGVNGGKAAEQQWNNEGTSERRWNKGGAMAKQWRNHSETTEQRWSSGGATAQQRWNGGNHGELNGGTEAEQWWGNGGITAEQRRRVAVKRRNSCSLCSGRGC